MIVTPGQARELLDGATSGPWHKCRDNHSDCDCSEDTVFGPDVLGSENPGIWWTAADKPIILAAPDMAETIAGMREEWRIEEWSGTYWYPCGEWDADGSTFDGYTARRNERLVRRLVSAPEVIDE